MIRILALCVLASLFFAAETPPPIKVDWVGSFLDCGSLSHVNRESAKALKSSPRFQIRLVQNGTVLSKEFDALAEEVVKIPSKQTDVTVRQGWPPDWSRPASGKLVVIQPWEFGHLPKSWVQAASQVDEFWAPSEFVRQLYVSSGIPKEKIVVIPYGVELEKFHPQAKPMELATKKKFRFLFVGGTIRRKGPDLLIQAYLNQFTAKDDVCLVIKDFGGKSFYAGQTIGPQIRSLQKIPDTPEILYIDEEWAPEAMPGIYMACDCFILPYRGEGFGLPALEAMACALPVIVTDGGPTDDFVDESCGYRIPAKKMIQGDTVGDMKLAGDCWLLEPNLDLLGKRMRYVYENQKEAKAKGTAASSRARDFSWKNVAALMEKRIEVLAKR